MTKPRVLLICSQYLFGESMERILRAETTIEMVGPWSLSQQDLPQRLLEAQPSVVVIADENMQSKAAAELTKTIIEQFPDLSVIRTGLSENTLQVVSTHTFPARGDNLLETIRGCVSPTQTNGADLS